MTTFALEQLEAVFQAARIQSFNQETFAPYIPDGYTLTIEEWNNGGARLKIEREYSNRMRYQLSISVNSEQIVQFLGFSVFNLRTEPAYSNSTIYEISKYRVFLSSILPRIKQTLAYLEQEQIRQAFQHLI